MAGEHLKSKGPDGASVTPPEPGSTFAGPRKGATWGPAPSIDPHGEESKPPPSRPANDNGPGEVAISPTRARSKDVAPRRSKYWEPVPSINLRGRESKPLPRQ